MVSVVDVVAELLGMDLSVYNRDLVFAVCSVFLLLVVSVVYDLLIMLFGYIGGRRR